MRGLHLCAIILFSPAAGPVLAQQPGQPAHEDHDQPVQGAPLAAGWTARPDGKATAAEVRFVAMGTGWHATLGPATILYRAQDAVTGRFHTLATFTQTPAPQHAEGYGLFFGGQALDGAGQKYTYFLVRGDGTFLVKRREGEKTIELTKGWIPHPAVHKADAEGKATNRLEIDGKASADKFNFAVNGQVVYSMDPKMVDPNGIIGLRINHNLEVHVDGFGVHRL
ncbi:MAG: hypothetical protein ACREMO_11150 [Gemmatimonadales bacterium]